MNFAKYLLIISTLCLNLASQKTLHAGIPEYAAAGSGTGAGVVEIDTIEDQPAAPLPNLSRGVAEYKPAAAAYDPTGTSAPATLADHSALATNAAGGGIATEEPFDHQALGVQPADNLTNEQRKAARLASLKLDRLPVSQTSSIASFLDAKSLGNFAASHKKGTSAVNYLVQGIRDNLVFPSDVEIVNPIIISLFAKAIINYGHQPDRAGKYKITPAIATQTLENAQLAGFSEVVASEIMDILEASINESQKPFRDALENAVWFLQPSTGGQVPIEQAREILASEPNPLRQMALRIIWYNLHRNRPMVENLDAINIKQIIRIETNPDGRPRLTLNFKTLTTPIEQDLQNIIDLISVLYKNMLALSIEPFECDDRIHIIGNFPSLTSLNAQSTTQLTSIDARLIAPNLKFLFLDNSAIKKISGNFPELITLHARKTKITSIDARLIAPRLHELSIARSSIKTISGNFPSLRTINAENSSQLTSIDSRLIAPKLTRLSLDYSSIRNISGRFPQLLYVDAKNTSELISIDDLTAPSLNLADWNNLREHVARNTALKEDE